ncbi:hypothetical protein [Nocardiopsis halotolerans]|uniref:hypothetical protein n=1 Tax=Nocardiopsis halotolerans TaxID=124252 RepID=UPI00034C7756|nr:hypothetical protein [Nocardiopsis halotolerans]
MPVPADQMGFLPDEHWEVLARELEANPDRLKNQYREAVAAHLRNPRPVELKEQEGAAAPPHFDFSKTFEATIVPGVLSLRVVVSASTGENWSAHVRVSAVVFGKEMGDAEVNLSAVSSYIEIHPSVLLAKADLKIGFYGERLCFGVEGRACYWALGWHCTPVNAQNLFCLRS